MSDTLLRAGTAVIVVLSVAGGVIGWLSAETHHFSRWEALAIRLFFTLFGFVIVPCVVAVVAVLGEVTLRALTYIFIGA